MNTPLYTALLEQKQLDIARFHMPGHKGTPVIPIGVEGIDFTETFGTGNLYTDEGPIHEAERLMARAYGAPNCFFLTGGTTMGLFTALAYCLEPGDTAVVDRNCHRAVTHALTLLGAEPEWIYNQYYSDYNITKSIRPEDVEAALSRAPGAKAVVVTSPTYYGVLSDIRALADVAKRHDAKLIVDGAHGAHLPFLTGYESAVSQGAYCEVVSAHKTLPALGQGALLLMGDGADARTVRRLMTMTGTSSPSYPILASLDLARARMEGELKEKYETAAAVVRSMRSAISASPVRALAEWGDLRLDPLRLTLLTAAGGIPGDRAAADLYERHKIAPELYDRRLVAFLVTGLDYPANLARLRAALENDILPRAVDTDLPDAPEPPRPERVLSLREAFGAKRERIALKDADGRVVLESICPYPPGVPVLVPGERLTQNMLAFLEEKRYTIDSPVDVVV